MMRILTKTCSAIICFATLLTLSGCSSGGLGPEAMVETYVRAVAEGNQSKAAKYTSGDLDGRRFAEAFLPIDRSRETINEFIRECERSLLEHEGTNAIVRWKRSVPPPPPDYGLGPSPVREIILGFSTVDFSLEKEGGKWKIVDIDFPEL